MADGAVWKIEEHEFAGCSLAAVRSKTYLEARKRGASAECYKAEGGGLLVRMYRPEA